MVGVTTDGARFNGWLYGLSAWGQTGSRYSGFLCNELDAIAISCWGV